MPAVAEPPVAPLSPTSVDDGGFMERMSQTLEANPFSQSNAPAPVTPPKVEPPVGQDGSKPVDGVAKADAKLSPADNLKKIAAGAPKDQPVTPPTQEQKKDFSMKELRLRAEKADTLEKELADVRKEIESAKALGATPDQLKVLTAERDSIKAERDEYKKKLSARDVMESDQYIESVSKPMGAIWAELRKDSQELKFPIQGLVDAMQIEDHRKRLSAISKALQEAHTVDENGEKVPLDELNKGNIVANVQEFLRREYYGKQLLADAGKTSEALKADKARKDSEEKEKGTQTFNQHADDIFKQMFNEEQLSDMPFLAPKGEDGKPKVDKDLMDRIRKSATRDKEPWRLALDSYSTEILPLVMEHSKNQDAKIAELEARIGKLSGAGPRGGGELRPEDNGSPESKLSLEDQVKSIQKAQGRL